MFKIISRVLLIALVFIGLLSLTNYLLANKIRISQQKFHHQQLSDLLTDINFNNDIIKSKINLNRSDYLKFLGINHPTINNKSTQQFQPIYIARYNNHPIAVILETFAPDGYNGNINLVVAIKLNANKPSTVIKIKVLQHHETPGLGDLIESEKSNWLLQFIHKMKSQIYLVKQPHNKDLTGVDSLSGATITSRAVTQAVNQALTLIDEHSEIYQ